MPDTMTIFSAPRSYKEQNYERLKKSAKDSGTLFEDPVFPANDSSLQTTPGKFQNIVWKRPKDIAEEPHLFVGGASSGDVHQGSLGNCWFVAATSCLAIHKSLWKINIPDPDEQDFGENYCGIFHFKFWQHGHWLDVVIDDLLPTKDGKLVFCHSQSKNEFWSPLLEKAYAKLFDGYEALDGGGLEEALVDFTGGIASTTNLVDEKNPYRGNEVNKTELFAELSTEMKRKGLMAAAIPPGDESEMEMITETGLVKGHAYGITAVESIALAGTGLFGMFKQDKIRMVRLRNPWGSQEWNGAFSDGSAEWDKIDGSAKKKIGLVKEDDGEFWMTFEDFVAHFMNVTICRVVNTRIFSINRTYEEAIMHGCWKTPDLAGGCANFKDTYLNNPQFAFSVTKSEDKVLMSLQQKIVDREKDKETIGFHLFKVEENRATRVHEVLKLTATSAFRNSRSVFMKEHLKQGRYMVLPATFSPGVEMAFLLRVYTDKSNHGKILTKEYPEKKTFCGLCRSAYSLATRITVVSAEGLEKQDTVGGADPYVVVSCEGNTYKTPVVKDSTEPKWETSFLLFRTNRDKPVSLEIRNENRVHDQFMGRVEIPLTKDVEGEVKKLTLTGKKPEELRPGHITVQITTRSSLDSF